MQKNFARSRADALCLKCSFVINLSKRLTEIMNQNKNEIYMELEHSILLHLFYEECSEVTFSMTFVTHLAIQEICTAISISHDSSAYIHCSISS